MPPETLKASLLHVPAEARARSLLRALLREASYLPDPTAKSFIHNHVLARFRRYPVGSSQHGAADRLKDGDKSLRYLKRASNGELDALQKVLQYTYGRVGKYRHKLMLEAMRPIPSLLTGSRQDSKPRPRKSDGSALPPLEVPKGIAGPFETSNGTLRFEVSDSFPVLKALLYSQTQRQGLPQSKATHEISATNIWDIRMPRKRQKNAAKSWWAKVYNEVQPPLPEHEWKQLRDRACGNTPWPGRPLRRTVVGKGHSPTRSAGWLQSLFKYGATDSLTAAQYVRNHPSRHTGNYNWRANGETQTSDGRTGEIQLLPNLDFPNAELDLFLKDQLHIRRFKKSHPKPLDGGHEITHRFMRRLWLKILKDCPYVTWDYTRTKPTVHWYEATQSPATP